MTPFACESRIRHVAVYARSAVVTRRVALSADLPAITAEIAVPGLTPLVEPGTFRARGAREVLSLHARLVIPPGPAPAGELAERVRALELEHARLEAEREHLAWRAGKLARLPLDMRLSGRDRRAAPAHRVKDALAVGVRVRRAAHPTREVRHTAWPAGRSSSCPAPTGPSSSPTRSPRPT